MVGSSAIDKQINLYFYICQKCKVAVLAFPVFKPSKKQVTYIVT